MEKIGMAKIWLVSCLFGSLVAYILSKDIDIVISVIFFNAVLFGIGWFFYNAVRVIVWHELDEEKKARKF